MQRRVHIIVTGRVQGVGYRASARDKAASLGLSGWVRNKWDGSVEITAEGDSFSVSTFINWCQIGPRWASVDELIVTDKTPTGESTDFVVRRDG